MRLKRFDRSVSLYTVVYTADAEGVQVPVLTLSATVYADVQPASSTGYRIAEYGADSTVSNAKIGYFDSSVTLVSGMIMLDTTYFIVTNVQVWDAHKEATFEPWNRTP